MLKLLRIRNLATIESAEIEFGPGLIALTGESGAGKSVVLDALSLLRGVARPRLRPGPFSPSLSGSRRTKPTGLVEADFSLEGPGAAEVIELLRDHGLPDDGTLTLARRLETSGRSRCFAQGQTIPRPLLAELGSRLLEQCGQGEAHGLKEGTQQLAALDRYLGEEALRESYRSAYGHWRALEKEAERLRFHQGEDERRVDFLEYQVSELVRSPLTSYDDDCERLDELERQDAIAAVCREVFSELGAGGESASAKVGWAAARIDAVDGSEELLTLRTLLGSLSEQLGDAALSASSLVETHALAPGELEELREQVEEVKNLASKHRVAPCELTARQAALEGELEELHARQARAAEIESELEEAGREVERLGTQLHQKRSVAATSLIAAVRNELGELGMAQAVFEIHLSDTSAGPSGTTHISMGFSANPGLAAAPLGRVASGGELARVLLAVRLAGGHLGPLMSFDEIDAGAGGEMAAVIGRTLKRASAHSQVLCVTHWPQVAGMADAHLAAVKRSSEDSTRSQLSVLTRQERIAELTRMLGGTSRAARSHARRLLTDAA